MYLIDVGIQSFQNRQVHLLGDSLVCQSLTEVHSRIHITAERWRAAGAQLADDTCAVIFVLQLWLRSDGRTRLICSALLSTQQVQMASKQPIWHL